MANKKILISIIAITLLVVGIGVYFVLQNPTIQTPQNKKDLSKYSDKEVFLISDDDWKQALQLVPLAVWTNEDKSVTKYPLLIYYNEKESDAFKINEETLGIYAYSQYIATHDEDVIDIELEEKELQKGETSDFLLTITNTKNTNQKFILKVSRKDIFSLSSNELGIEFLGEDLGYNIYEELTQVGDRAKNTYQGVQVNKRRKRQQFQLRPGETKKYSISITLNRVPGGGFDADSIIHFMQQYSPDKITIVGDIPQELDDLLTTQPKLGAGLTKNQIQKISINDYLSYWQSFKDVVYVKDDYKLALLASTYASLINAPLIVQGADLDIQKTFSGKNVICAGNVIRQCDEQYDLERLQRKYVELTNTDKIILVNPDDLHNIKLYEKFVPEKSSAPINELYNKHSLAAPILASAKHELIISASSADYQDVDRFIKGAINNLQIAPEYLTIVASPLAIQMSRGIEKKANREEVDNHIYGNLDNDFFQELAVGRIFSLTVSDVSSYLARVLFYSEIPKSSDFTLLWPPDFLFYYGKLESIVVKRIFKNMGFNSVSFISNEDKGPLDASVFENKFMITYIDHASPYGGEKYKFTTPDMISEKVRLNSPLIFMMGCSTCGFENADDKSKLFCANLLRRGAVFHAGATVEDSGITHIVKMLIEELLAKENIGQAMKSYRNIYALSFKKGKNIISIKNPGKTIVVPEYEPWNVLIGDPTFSPNLAKPKLDKTAIKLNKVSESDYVVDILIPERNKNIGGKYNKSSEADMIPLNILYKGIVPPSDRRLVTVDTRLEANIFEYLYGELGGALGHTKLFYDTSTLNLNYSDEVIFEKYHDVLLLAFSLSIPKDYSIKQINDVEYIGQTITKSVKRMPVFEAMNDSAKMENGAYIYIDYQGYPSTEDFDYIQYEKDEGENTYYFIMRISYGGDPPIVKGEVIPAHQFKIYLELEKMN